jgi:PAT family beta-lactamase induction signal transducer AmpG
MSLPRFAPLTRTLGIYANPRLLAILCLGFASGMPLALSGSTLGIWLTEAGVDKTSIGLFAALGSPYAFKFAWSPLIDSLPFPLLSRLLGRRRGWIVATQLGLMAAIVALGCTDPGREPWITAALALAVAFLSASQDIVIDAYRVELLTPEQYGAGSAMAVLGYRLGMIASSAGALFLADAAGWALTYMAMAGCLLVGTVTVLVTGEPPASAPPPAHRRSFTQWLQEAVIAPFADFMRHDRWWLILLFVLFYKFGDAFVGVMTGPFLIKTGFTKSQIAEIAKLYGLIATILGSFAGGAMVYRLGLVRTLWIGGFLQMITILFFIVQQRAGADMRVLMLTISAENFSGGIGTSAFVAYLSALCNARFTATQYALLSSLAAVGRTLLTSGSGKTAEILGWEGFFILSTLFCLPGLFALWLLGRSETLRPTSPRAEATSG